jgi:hypothetical protein
MSPDTIDSFIVDLTTKLETWGMDLSDLDGCYDDVSNFILDWFELHYTKDRNYN